MAVGHRYLQERTDIMYVYVCIYMYIYIHTHTYIQLYVQVVGLVKWVISYCAVLITLKYSQWILTNQKMAKTPSLE